MTRAEQQPGVIDAFLEDCMAGNRIAVAHVAQGLGGSVVAGRIVAFDAEAIRFDDETIIARSHMTTLKLATVQN